jgi:chromosome partitioning protein
MAIVIAVASNKGGVGKTTLSMNLGAAFAEQGLRTLLVDADGQANLTRYFGYPEAPDMHIGLLMERYAKEAELGKEKRLPFPYSAYITKDTILRDREYLNLIPANKDLPDSVLKLNAKDGNYGFLRGVLEEVIEEYDIVLIDCPPSKEFMTVNALYAADYYMIAMIPEPLSTDGIKTIQSLAENIKKLNPGLGCLGGVYTKNEQLRTTLGEMAHEDDLALLGDKIFPVTIPKNNLLSECIYMGKNIFEYDRLRKDQKLAKTESPSAKAYLQLAEAVLQRLETLHGKEASHV